MLSMLIWKIRMQCTRVLVNKALRGSLDMFGDMFFIFLNWHGELSVLLGQEDLLGLFDRQFS